MAGKVAWLGACALAMLGACGGSDAGPAGDGGAGDGSAAVGGPTDGAADGLTNADRPPAESDAATEGGCPPAGAVPDAAFVANGSADEFGPNAKPAQQPSALARVNVYEVTTPTRLLAAEVFVEPAFPQTRLTVAVHEAPDRKTPFRKLLDVQLDVPACAGYVGTGAVEIELYPGFLYAIGYDPNQAIGYAVVTETGSLPVDGRFGRLVGSKSDTSVSVPELPWMGFADREYYRQRLWTTPSANQPPRDAGPPPDGPPSPG